MSEYDSWKSQIRSEIEAFEGEGPPSVEDLWYQAKFSSESAANWIEDMPVNQSEITTAKGDLLKALVALEMAEERLSDD